MSTIQEFIFLENPALQKIVLGTILISISSAIIGSFTLLQKRALSGDVIAHAILPGICIAFMIQGDKNLPFLILGAFVSGWAALISVDLITKWTNLKQDSALAIILSLYYGIGITLLKIIEQSPAYPNKAGLNNFLFGSATQLVLSDIKTFGITGLLISFVILLFYRQFKVFIFDKTYAEAIGLNIKLLQIILTSLTVLAVVIGIQTVGIVLMAAMLITPAAIATFWTKSLRKIIIIGALIAIVSSWMGCFLSYSLEIGEFRNLPTGPSIVMFLSLIGLMSFMFTPKKGIIIQQWKKRKFNRTIQVENLLKALYKYANSHTKDLCFNEIRSVYALEPNRLKKITKMLMRRGYLKKKGQVYTLTNIGFEKGKRVTKIHRLWELYMTKFMNVDSYSVHNDAESIEHVLTPELEAELERELNYPKKDPHDKPIPYA